MKNSFFLIISMLLVIIPISESEIISSRPYFNLGTPKFNNEELHQASDTIKEFIRYVPVDDKVLGIWPRKETWFDVEKLKILKDKYGFTKILIRPYRDELQRVVKAGFNSANVWAYFFNTDLISEIVGVGTIYSDEPAHFYNNKGLQDKSPNEILKAINIIDTLDPKPDFVMGTYKWEKNVFGDWKISDLFLNEYNKFADGIMYTDYTCRCKSSPEENRDQRPAWQQMKNIFGNKFSEVWIGAHTDTLEYADLIDEAENLGIKNIWLFQDLDPYNDFTNIERFCEIAWEKGWLKKIESTYFRD